MGQWDSSVEELIAATAEARAVIREMHEATKDLNQATKEAKRAVREEFKQIFSEEAGTVFAALQGNLDDSNKTLQDWVDKSAAKVADDFNSLMEVYVRRVDAIQALLERKVGRDLA